VTAVSFPPDGSLLASASLDKTVRLWDAKSGDCRCVHIVHGDGPSGTLRFSPNGLSFTTNRGTFQVESWVTAVSFSPVSVARLMVASKTERHVEDPSYTCLWSLLLIQLCSDFDL
jgi:WD40 repeat protein